MADDASSTHSSERRGGSGRGGRGGASRGEGGRGDGSRGDGGGFRIRLSDNEMQAARALQEAFGLRSTVAVLGFALRSLAQQLEQGQLDELIRQHRAQAGSRPPGGGRDGERRGGRGEAGGGAGARPKADPFARPSRPAATAAEEAIVEAPAEEEQPDDAVASEGDAGAGLDPAVASPEAEPVPGADSTTAEDAVLATGTSQA